MAMAVAMAVSHGHHVNRFDVILMEILVLDLPPHLYGISFVGDNIQDEWFIVSILFYLSRQLPDCIIRSCDSDGEFLLIEAADHLPQWANPETCEQRVSIFLENATKSHTVAGHIPQL